MEEDTYMTVRRKKLINQTVKDSIQDSTENPTPISDKQLEDFAIHVQLDKKNRLKFIHAKQKNIINLAISHDAGESWKHSQTVSLKTRQGFFDESSLIIFDAFLVKEGVLLFYFVEEPCAIGAALFDKKIPEQILWRSANPICKIEKKVIPQQISKLNRIITLELKEDGKIHVVKFSIDFLLGKLKRTPRPQTEKIAIKTEMFSRSEDNPILKPRSTFTWENSATFNPAAIYLDGKVHFLYRAIGNKGMSVLGYAASHDGIHIHERSSEPVYIPYETFEYHRTNGTAHLIPSPSGGGWGGCEDPRLVKIGNTIYMTYTAYNGMEPPGVALTSIKVNDFLNKKWRWQKPMLISPRGQISKNWVLFPEKLQNQFAILHSISPGILIDYFDRLDGSKKICITSYYGPSMRNGCWDNQVRGAGPPPLKTQEGWLLFYHAMDKRDPNKYKIGAMLLDSNDPTKVLYRSLYPVLEPHSDYEIHGYKGNVIYACGAVIIKEQLFIYYGSADQVACVATANLIEFLEKLKCYQPPKVDIITK